MAIIGNIPTPAPTPPRIGSHSSEATGPTGATQALPSRGRRALEAIARFLHLDRRLAQRSPSVGPAVEPRVAKHQSVSENKSSQAALDISDPQLKDRDHFDTQLVKPCGWDDLPASLRNSFKFKAALSDAAKTLEDPASTPNAINDVLSNIGKAMNGALKALPLGPRTAFTLDDGAALVKGLTAEIVKCAHESKSASVAFRLGKAGLPEVIDHALSGLTGSAKKFNAGEDIAPALSRHYGSDEDFIAEGVPKEISLPGKGVPRRDWLGRVFMPEPTVYKAEKFLGNGNFGSVYLFTSNTKPPSSVVVKVPKNTYTARENGVEVTKNTTRETRVAEPAREGLVAANAFGSGGGAKHIAALTGMVRTDDKLLLVFEQAKFGDLKNAVRKFDQPDDATPARRRELVQMKLTLALDIVHGVQRLQQAKGIEHFDIALRNVLLKDLGNDEGVVAQIADFGRSESFADGAAIKTAELPKGEGKGFPIRWTAPEVLAGQPSGPKADTWSTGMALYELFYSAEKPFPNVSTNQQVLELIVKEDFDPSAAGNLLAAPPSQTDWPGIDVKAVQALLIKMLQRDPDVRPMLDVVAADPLFTTDPDVGSGPVRKGIAELLSLGPVSPQVVQPDSTVYND